MVLGQDRRERVSGEGFPHHVAQTVLGPSQERQSDQRGALDPGRGQGFINFRIISYLMIEKDPYMQHWVSGARMDVSS